MVEVMHAGFERWRRWMSDSSGFTVVCSGSCGCCSFRFGWNLKDDGFFLLFWYGSMWWVQVALMVDGEYSGGHPGGFGQVHGLRLMYVLGLILGLCCWARAGSALLGFVSLGFLI
ncbi:hypothetical protein RchiOBHm_Chr1g0354691 [Rosa chinensis]|uniref:Transmembrane protein n=1 Tax=Rosa chinensis TaxID=74649 RepID=A0A2P6SH71_ROSCH|nr:hypothetical protein RchiOBHm_Chr1g0354691 [Rosa chinensis]